MRVEDAKQVEPIVVDPIKRFKLLRRIHHESHRTLSPILHEKHLFNPVVLPCQQTARFQWDVAVDMLYNLIDLITA
jgi:hypothetical protein